MKHASLKFNLKQRDRTGRCNNRKGGDIQTVRTPQPKLRSAHCTSSGLWLVREVG